MVSELPGMWDESDLYGGWTDAEDHLQGVKVHPLTSTSITRQGLDAHVGRVVRYRCGCDYLTSGASWILCRYHEGFNDGVGGGSRSVMNDPRQQDDVAQSHLEDFGYELGWVALGSRAGDDGCEAARAMGDAIVGAEEMRAIKAVLQHLAARQATEVQAPTVDVLRLLGLPDIAIEWVLS